MPLLDDKTLTFLIEENDNKRLDTFISEKLNVSRQRYIGLIDCWKKCQGNR